MARDAKGTLKASRIVQLRKVAMETGDDRFIEGVQMCIRDRCISARELIDGGYITESCYRNWVNRGRIKVVRRGGGAAGDVYKRQLSSSC